MLLGATDDGVYSDFASKCLRLSPRCKHYVGEVRGIFEYTNCIVYGA